jgi:hypothetical protein
MTTVRQGILYICTEDGTLSLAFNFKLWYVLG